MVWAFLHLDGGGETSELLRRLLHILPLALLIGVATYAAMWYARQDGPLAGQSFALALAALEVAV